MNVLTIAVLIVFVVFIGMGFARGLVKSVFKIILTTLSILLAYLLSPIISGVIIEHTDIDNAIRNKIYTAIEDKIEDKIREELGETTGQMDGVVENQLVEQYLEDEPNRNSQIEFIQDMEIPEFLKTALIDNNHIEMKEEIGVTSFYDYVSTYLSRMIVNAIGFMLTFIVLMLVFHITLLLMNMVMKLPGLNMVNRMGGALLGFVEALLLVWICFVLIDFCVGTKAGASLLEQINESKILSVVYDNNIVAHFLQNLFKGI